MTTTQSDNFTRGGRARAPERLARIALVYVLLLLTTACFVYERWSFGWLALILATILTFR